MASQEPIQIALVPTDVEAAAIVTALDAEGILAFAAGGELAGFRAETPAWVSVRVRREDVERAQLALRRIRSEVASMDWSSVDVGQPEESEPIDRTDRLT